MKATKAGPRKRAQIRDEVMVYYKDLYIIDDYDEEQSSDQQEEEEIDKSPQKVKTSNLTDFWVDNRDEIKKFENPAHWYQVNRKEQQKYKLVEIAKLYGQLNQIDDQDEKRLKWQEIIHKSEELFKYLNFPPDHDKRLRPYDYEIDLHGQTIRKMLEYLETYLEMAQNNLTRKRVDPNHALGDSHIYKIICGEGKNSINGQPKLKFAVYEYLKSKGYDYFYDEQKDDGTFLIRMAEQ